ncbi:TonB-dependent siderophore receptor [Vibrio sp. SCSIO 43135]|uniref:TonB-dependent siderophore receptor n=1 Tax=Vibrio sp. SCSIO 43135 TaxID=2819096 RepID=UPI0020757BCB|nr:TonB-dependent siderophore receptor [Vibrio sp. SCSIO 43135]USD40276.1 TonB-dependent siderophore receptor [Vibrio sp. SCSIO 43135]
MTIQNSRPLFVRTSLACAISISLLASFQTVAEETDSSDVETISVLGKAYRNTATKTSLEPEETPQAINVIESETLEARGVKSLNQALRYTPGVVTEQKGSSVTMYDTFNIRGFDVSQSYYDGLVLQSLAGWNLQPQIDPIALQQVEIFKGPTSVLYGAMPPGGMVNMIAKSPQQEANTDIGVATGSRNLMEASIDSTGQIGNSDLNYRFIALARKQDGQVDHTEEERYVIAPSIDWNISEKTLLNLNIYYQNDPAMGMNSSMPASGMFVDNPNGSTNPNTFVGDKNWSTFEREVFLAGYKFEHQFNSNWSFLQNFRYMKADLYQENTYHTADQFDPATGNLDRTIYDTTEKSEGIVIDNQLSAKVMTGDVEHNILFGLDYQKLDGNSLYNEYGSTSQFGTFNLFDPNNDMIDRSQLSKTSEYEDKVKVEQLGMYFQDQLRWDRWVLIAGGRYDQFKSSSDYTGQYQYGPDWYPYENYTEADQNQFSYRVGGLYEFENGVAPFISYATSFEPTVSTEGQNYKPEMGEQVEVGVKYMAPDMSKSGSISLFNIVKSDALMADPLDPWGAKLQVGELTSRGLEAQGTWFITDALDIAANYTYLDVEVTQDSENGLEGTTPIYIPEHAANLWANYFVYDGALAGTRASAGVRYVGEMQMDATNTQGMVPSYTTVDLSLGYDMSYLSSSLSGASANLIVNNLFNEESYTCYDMYNCWYGAEQTVELNVSYNF